jgi:hypothetical protein
MTEEKLETPDSSMDTPPSAVSVEVQGILDSIKDAGIQVALIRKDGALLSSSLHMDGLVASSLAHLTEVAGTLLKRAGDTQKELELIVDDDLVVVIPLDAHFLCGFLKNREQKKILREHAANLKHVL